MLIFIQQSQCVAGFLRFVIVSFNYLIFAGDTLMTPKEAVEFAKKNNARILDLKFMDFIGSWQHFSVPIGELEESL